MKKITILINTQSVDALSLEQVRALIKEQHKGNIITNCLEFAQFDYLDEGYQVEVVRYNEDNQVEKVVLSELLDNNRNYTVKEISRAQNVQKMVVAGALNFLPPLIGFDSNGVEIKLGDMVHCYDGKPGEESESLRGVVNERDGKIFVGDNELALGCAETVEIIN